MLTVLIFTALAILFVRGARRVRAEEAGAASGGPVRGTLDPADGTGSIDWGALVTPRRKRVARFVGVAALLGGSAVVAGGVLFGLAGLVGGTALLAMALAWAVSLRVARPARRSHPGEALTDRERSEFDQIVARLTADD